MYLKVLILSLIVSGCSTANKTNLSIMAGAGLIGSSLGSETAPKGESKSSHALLWGSMAAATAGAIAMMVNDDSKKLEEQRLKIMSLEQAQLEIQNNPPQEVLAQGSSQFSEKNLPKEYRHLLSPGKWRIYKVNRWQKISDNEFVHQDKLVEIIPPQPNPKYE